METALVFLPFFALLLALIDYSLAIFKRNTFQNAVREGTRYAITGQTYSVPVCDGTHGQDQAIKDVVQNNSMGFITDRSMIHIDYYDGITLAASTANSAYNIVVVSIQGYSHSWIAAMWRSATPLPIAAASADLVEPAPAGGAPCR